MRARASALWRFGKRAGAFPFPPMRARLEQPHRRRHKAPPPPCALTTTVGLLHRKNATDLVPWSKDGPPEKKFHLESGLNQRDRAEYSASHIKKFR